MIETKYNQNYTYSNINRNNIKKQEDESFGIKLTRMDLTENSKISDIEHK